MNDIPAKPLLSAVHAPRLDDIRSTPITLQNGGDFSALLSGLILSSSMAGSGSSSSPMGATGLGVDLSLMIYSMLEKMIAAQVDLGQVDLDPTGFSTSAGGPVPNGLPLKGRLTQSFQKDHNGIDWGTPVGTPVHTTMDGKVVYAGWNDQGYGNLVIVENGPYRTYYAHLSEIPVQVGQTVRAGATIGLSGNTGNSTGPHLHYEVRRNGQPLDPEGFLARG